MTDIRKLVRPDILEMVPYTSARNTFNEDGYIFLDANENPSGENINRYPDPFQNKLKKELAKIYGVDNENLFLGNGSDEILDLVIRVFCMSEKDNIVTIDPSYGMYEVLGNLNRVEVRKAPLNRNYDLDAESLLGYCNQNTKMIILCSPNNPSGNLLNELEIYKILNTFKGIVLIDEAYIEFSGSNGFYKKVKRFKNLVALRTFSKAWGLAGIRLGYAFADKEVVWFLNKAKYPYNVNRLTQKKAFQALKKRERIMRNVKKLIKERERLALKISDFSFVKKVYPSQANYLLISVKQSKELIHFLKERKLIVRDRTGITHCDKCIRITIGTKKQNDKLLNAMRSYEAVFDSYQISSCDN